jgi:hypothetical protein
MNAGFSHHDNTVVRLLQLANGAACVRLERRRDDEEAGEAQADLGVGARHDGSEGAERRQPTVSRRSRSCGQ